jgi:RHS repeat-associated protein
VNYSRYTLFVALFVLLAGAVSSAAAQDLYTVDTKPPRGFMPASDQLSSPVDSIDAVNGKLHLRIPLASLPRGKAGSGFDLELNYDSHLYDLVPGIHQEVIRNRGPFPIFDLGSIVNGGGWTYNFRNYGLELEIRQDADLSKTCPSDENVRVYRLRVSLGDGSLHVLHLRGSGNETDLDTYRGDGFFQVAPNGSPSACGAINGVRFQSGWLTYYTSDGSFLKLEIYADGSGSSWSKQPWHLFFPDGRRIASRPGIMELFDPNGNRIRVAGGCVDFPDCTQPYSLILDSSNHEIRVDYVWDANTAAPKRDVITAQGPNGPITSTVDWETLRIGGNGRQFVWSDSDQLPLADLDIVHNVVRYIQLPLTGAVSPPGNAPVWNSYEFRYSDNSVGGFGELAYMRTPTGSQYKYQYNLESETGLCNFTGGACATRDIVQKNSVRRKAITHDGLVDELVWTYTISTMSKSVVRSPGGAETVHWIYTDRGDWKTGLVYQIDEPHGSVRKRVWAQNAVWGLRGGITLLKEPNNPYIQKETVTVGNIAGQPAKTAVISYAYDKNGNLLQRTEYDWVPYNSSDVENGTTVRRSTTLTYYNTVPAATAALADDPNAYWRPQSPALPAPTTAPQPLPVRRLNAVRRSAMSDASTIFAVTEYDYDDPLTRGNVTAEKRWDSVKSSSVPGLGQLNTFNAQVLTRSYDAYGNLTDSYEPEVRTHITYDANFDMPVRVDYAYGTTSQRSWQYSWNSNGIALIEKKDLDNNVSTVYTYDNVGRQRTATEAGARKTETLYDDAALKVTMKRDLASAGDGKLQTTTEYDQLGRPFLVRTTEPANPDGIKVRTIYLPAAARVIRSNPYRTTSDATLEWTCSQMDGLNRLITIAIFKGGVPPESCEDTANRTGTTRNVYDAEWITITDPSMKVRKEQWDALGHLVQVSEDPLGLNYNTSYSFDPLDNLTGVAQGAQPRTFQYSSLSRLRTAKNPESGVTSYTYNDSGDLATRTDSRGVVTTLAYDPMHRLVSKIYSNDPASTPATTYVYYLAGSSASPAAGQLQSVSSLNGSVQYDTYDNLGRVIASTHGISGYPGTLSFKYAYWLNDGLKMLTYPSGHVLNYVADDAGRPVKVFTNSKVYADLTGASTPYTADGRLGQMQLGNGLWDTRSYQTPGASTIFKLGTSAGANDRLQLEYNYSATQNNGNLISHTISQPGRSWTQTYSYDPLNRIASVNEGSAWNQTFGCDQYGNCWIASLTGLTGTDIHQPTVSANFDATTNRLYVMNSAFDAAGNQTHYAPYTLAYDAENRTISATSSANGNGAFSYDPDGRRIKKTWTSSGATATTYYFYDALGQLASEYSTQPAVSTGTSYVHTDLLGSVRMVTGEKPSNGPAPVLECYDYLPYGRLLNSGDNNRNTGCYPASPDTQLTSRLTQKFTGKERDSETKLDFFGARYFSAPQQRFTSADIATGVLQNPQSWNKYAYTFNNPLRYVDLNGKWPTGIHNGILAGAFPTMSRDQIALLRAGSFAVDLSLWGQTLPSHAYQHGMMRPGETPQEAARRTDTYIHEHLERALMWQGLKRGIIAGDVLTEFGKAMHPVMDRLSPAHKGQTFEGVPFDPRNLLSMTGIAMEVMRMTVHSAKESKINRKTYEQAVDDVRRYYLKTFGKEAFKKATGCDKVEGCEYSYKQLDDYWEK